MLADLKGGHTAVDLFGQRFDYPIMLAPVAFQKLAHPDGDLVGRPHVHALAAAGPAGVAHVLHILRTELEVAMALTGCRTLADVDRSVLGLSDSTSGL